MELDPIQGIYKQAKSLSSSKDKNSGTKIVCPSCANPVQATDINIQDKIAKCGSCHEVFSFQHVMDIVFPKTVSNKKPILGKPEDIDISQYKDELNISVINYSDWIALILFLIGMATLFGSFIAAMEGRPSIIASLFGLATFSSSIFRFIRYRENKARIDVDERYVYIRKDPPPFGRIKKYNRSDVRQFYSKFYGGNGSSMYHLYMIVDSSEGQKHIKVTPYLKSHTRALYLEQELENFLGLPDERVLEEAPVN